MRHIKALIVIPAVCLLVILSSCTAAQLESPSGTPGTAAQLESPSGTPGTAASQDKAGALLTTEDILAYLRERYSAPELKILNTTEVGENLLLVEFYPKACNWFVLCHLDTGDYEIVGNYDMELKKVVTEDYFIFERKGEFEEGAFYPFPYIIHCIRVNDDSTVFPIFKTVRQDECFELGRSVRAGSKTSDKLGAVTAGLDGFQLVFKPADGEAGQYFYAAAPYIPVTVTSYDADTRQFTVKLIDCQIEDTIEKDTDIKTDCNAYVSSYKVTEDDGNIYIALTLRPPAAGYMISSGIIPDGDKLYEFPIVSVRFVNADYLQIAQAW